MSADRSKAGTCSAYGKLRASREYIWKNCGTPSARWFQAWIDAAAPLVPGIEGLQSLRVCLSAGTKGVRIAGMLWPSTDAGGLRSFPFALFREWTSVEPVPEASALAPFFTGCAALHDRLRAVSSEIELGKLLDESLEDRRVGGEEASAPPQLSLEHWLAELFGGMSDRFALALWRLGRGVRELRAMRPGTSTSVLCPLAPHLFEEQQADAWLEAFRLGSGSVDWVLIESRLVGPALLVVHPGGHPGELAAFGRGKPSTSLDVLGAEAPRFLDGFTAFSRRVHELVTENASAAPRRLMKQLRLGQG